MVRNRKMNKNNTKSQTKSQKQFTVTVRQLCSVLSVIDAYHRLDISMTDKHPVPILVTVIDTSSEEPNVSCNFMPCHTVRQVQILQFHVRHFQRPWNVYSLCSVKETIARPSTHVACTKTLLSPKLLWVCGMMHIISQVDRRWGWSVWTISKSQIRRCLSSQWQVHEVCYCHYLLLHPFNGLFFRTTWLVGCWRGYLSGARCRLANGPADATATHCLFLVLAHLGSPGKRTVKCLNGCVCVSTATWVSQYQKGKTSLGLNEARDDGVFWMQWHQLDHTQTICTALQTDSHTNTSSLNFTGRTHFLTPNQ